MWVSVALVACLAGTAACALRGPPETIDREAAERAVRATAPDEAIRAIFAWRILDGEARFSGTGAARVEAPYRARLDLFGARDEHYLSAAVVGSVLRVPGEAEGAIPPSSMIWAVLGVVLPPEGAVLEGTRQRGSELELYYAAGERRIRYVLEGTRLRYVEWRGAGRRMVVELEGESGGLPQRSAYRDWSRNTELHIELESVEDVEPYPPEIWTPGR